MLVSQRHQQLLGGLLLLLLFLLLLLLLLSQPVPLLLQVLLPVRCKCCVQVHLLLQCYWAGGPTAPG
jgi:hypothetical protein